MEGHINRGRVNSAVAKKYFTGVGTSEALTVEVNPALLSRVKVDKLD